MMGKNDESTGADPRPRDYAALSQLLTAERLGSYLRWSEGSVEGAFARYEWNMTACAAVMHTTGMVEVVVRSAMDRSLQGLGGRRGWSSWFDAAPLDSRCSGRHSQGAGTGHSLRKPARGTWEGCG